MVFDHERLDVYREALSFVAWASQFIASASGKAAAKDHLDRASTSVVLNIAEGNGKFSTKDRCRFLDIAYGSAIECVACLDVFIAKEMVQPSKVEQGRESLNRIVSMLVKLRSSLLNRVCEDSVEYEVNNS